MFKRIIAIMLGLGGAIVALYFFFNPTPYTYSSVLWIGFVLVCVLAVKLYISSYENAADKAQKEVDLALEALKDDSEIFIVNLEDLEIVRENFAEVGAELGEEEMRKWQAIHDLSSEVGYKIDQIILRYKTNYNGKPWNFFHVLYSIEEQNLMLALMKQKTTSLYIKEVDGNLFYTFDFSFLKA